MIDGPREQLLSDLSSSSSSEIKVRACRRPESPIVRSPINSSPRRTATLPIGPEVSSPTVYCGDIT